MRSRQGQVIELVELCDKCSRSRAAGVRSLSFVDAVVTKHIETTVDFMIGSVSYPKSIAL